MHYPPHRTLLLVLLVPALLLALWSQPATAATPAEDQEVLALVNAERAARGLSPLILETRLILAAQRHSEDMAAHDFCGHVGSDGRRMGQRISDLGYPWLMVGEVLTCSWPTPVEAVQSWMRSSLHTEILMHPAMVHIGVGHAYNPNTQQKHYWTVDLGQPAGGYTTATPNVAASATPSPSITPSRTPTPTRTPPPTATLVPPPPTETLPAYVPPTPTPRGPSPTPLPWEIMIRMTPRIYIPGIEVDTTFFP